MTRPEFYSRTTHRRYHKEKQIITAMHIRHNNLPKVKAILSKGGKIPAELRSALASLASFFTEVRFYYWLRQRDGRVLLIGENINPTGNQQKQVRVTLNTYRDIHIVERQLGVKIEELGADVQHGTINTTYSMSVVGYIIDDREYKGKMYSIMPLVTRIGVVMPSAAL